MNKHHEAISYFLSKEEGDNITITCDFVENVEVLKELVDFAYDNKVSDFLHQNQDIISDIMALIDYIQRDVENVKILTKKLALNTIETIEKTNI